MATATATADYTLETTESGWGHLHHRPCGEWTSFVNPTDERVRWYMASHICGPPGSEWHTNEPATDDHRTESPVATATWIRALSRYVGTRPRGLLMDATVWPALEELGHTLGDLFPEWFATARTAPDVVEAVRSRRGAAGLARGDDERAHRPAS